MLFNRQPWWFGVIVLLLIWATKSVAQPNSKPLSEPFWHPIYKPTATDLPSTYYTQPDPYGYENFDQLLQKAKEGQKIEALVVTKEACQGGNMAVLSQLKSVRQLNLSGLTTGQTDSLFQFIQNWPSLERLTIFEYLPIVNKPETGRLVTAPVHIQRLPKLTEIRLNGDYRQWQQTIESLPMLRSLSLDQISSIATNPTVLDLSKLSQLEQLKISGQNWIVKPTLFSNLKQLRDLSLVGVKVDTATFQQTINGLTGLKVMTLDNIRQLQKLNLSKLTSLNELYLYNNLELTVDASDFINLSNLERLSITINQPFDLSGICALTHLQSLRVSGRGMPMKIPDCLGQLSLLTDLRIANLKLDRLPATLGSLRHLKKLDVSYCGVDSLPSEISQLAELEDLNLGGNKLRQLPNLRQIRALRVLDVNGNQLTALPDDIGQLIQLTSLNVSRNKLAQLPGSLNRLTSLRTLSLENNQLERLPDDLGRLHKLHHLSLINNQLRELPNSIGQLDSLTSLAIGNNRLKSLPNSLGQLHNLTDLNIGTNELTTLPATIGSLSKLVRLAIEPNPIAELPPSICELRNLESLSIMGTQIRLLPDNIGALTKLQRAMLNDNELIALPNSIGRWQSLMSLSLDRNKLEGLPNSIGRLMKLNVLRITGKEKVVEGATGGIQQLPDSLIYCSNLWDVTIERQPQFDADDALTKLARLKRLFSLHLSECNISHLPNLSWKDVNWGMLMLDQNLLTELPVGILDAPKLNTVSLWNNRLPEALNQSFHDKEALRVAFVNTGLLPLESLRKPNRKVTTAYQQLANQKARTRDWSGAMSDIEKAIEYAPDTILALPYAHRASMHFFRKEYAEALADYNKAIEYAPQLRKDKGADPEVVNRNLATYWQQKAAILNMTGKQADAFMAIIQAERFLPLVDMSPLSGIVYTEKGRYLALTGKQAEADSSFSKAMSLYEKLTYAEPGIRLTVVELGLLTGKYDRAKSAINNLPANQMRDGYATLKEYLTACLAILQNEQTGAQATTQFSDYLAKHPAKVFGWSFDLFDNWLNKAKLAPEKVTALRQLTDAVKERLVKP
ncbi:hypothetical protein GCM10028805_21490 [Spirosoma harenae]